MRIAVIDTEIYNENDRGETNKWNSDVEETHGTNIVKIMRFEAPEAEIIPIKVLAENNRGNLVDLIEAIEKAIELKVDIINMSLGFTSKSYKRLADLHKVCIRAYEQNIVLIAAYKNGLYKTEESYPAYFDEVIGVGYNIGHYDGIRRENNNLFFSNNTVYVPYRQKNQLRIGSSYLAAYVTGVVANSQITKYEGILDLFTQLGKNFYFNKYKFDFKNYFFEKKFYYLGNVDNPADIEQVRIFYRRWMQGELIDYKDARIFNKCIDVDIIILGMNERWINSGFIYDIIIWAANHGKTIIMPFPYINTYERNRIIENYNLEIICLYL